MMQCKDIPDRPILEFIASFGGQWCFTFDKTASERSVFWAMPDGTPDKLGCAKMKQLVRRGLVDGCTCGCRGDYTLTDKGEEFLAKEQA